MACPKHSNCLSLGLNLLNPLEELGALLTDLTKVLRGHDLDYYYGNMRSKLSGFIDKVIILNRTGKINNTEANEIGMRAAALKSSFED
jgi:hypothetical protein